MRSTAIRRTAVAATAVSLALFATACGGSDSGSGDKGKDAKGKESAAAAPAAKALSAAELEKAALAQGDVKGHKISKAAAKDTISVDDIKVEKKVCAPLANALMGAQVGEPGAFTKRTVVSEPKKGDLAKQDSGDAEEAFKAAFDITTTQLALGSYDGKGAQESVASLRTAATECAGGFEFTAAGEKQKAVKITEEQVKGGEEAAAWAVQLEQGGEKVVFKLVALRQGASFASFSSMNMAMLAGEVKDFDLPTAVVEAQAAKLA
ncbi:MULTISPECIES: hypothetical protein [unclassified Streptomyces]|uniref:hypothetical protein n=1 Tax=unclassified Streptomyces TaxID=2593676 RepID=UPI00081B343D|nr:MULTISPECIES: hypothetical protein [unclassified Streptomyces]MEE1747853.1 hypothetical protein [Streptomyces sp. JV184]MYQ83661.1 hypothetical protein [Streptomyces sp. SID4936]SCD70922.1 hypothetical protein GA0115234_1042109 [Streptomyces sp. DvalAA-43]